MFEYSTMLNVTIAIVIVIVINNVVAISITMIMLFELLLSASLLSWLISSFSYHITSYDTLHTHTHKILPHPHPHPTQTHIIGADAAYGSAYEILGSGEAGRAGCQAIGALANIGQIDSTITNFLEPLQVRTYRIHSHSNLPMKSSILFSSTLSFILFLFVIVLHSLSLTSFLSFFPFFLSLYFSLFLFRFVLFLCFFIYLHFFLYHCLFLLISHHFLFFFLSVSICLCALYSLNFFIFVFPLLLFIFVINFINSLLLLFLNVIYWLLI